MPDPDALVHAAERHHGPIRFLYSQLAHKKPIMLLDIQEQRIYAYPYADFANDLSQRSQQSLKVQYEAALREGQIVVFVRDNEQRRLISFSLDEE